MTPADSVNDVIKRLCDAYRVADEAALAERQQMGRIRFRVWRNRGEVPSRTLVRCSQETGVTVGWLLGVEPIHTEHVARTKPRYRLNLDGSTSLVSCGPMRFAELAMTLPRDLTGVEVTEIRKRAPFVRNVLDELRRGYSLKQQSERLGMSVAKLGRIIRGTSGLPPGYTILAVRQGLRMPGEVRP